MINSQLQGAQVAHRSYTDLNSLQNIRQQDKEGAIKEVASQFESIYMQMMIKSMRDANSAFSEGNFLNTSEMKFHQDMLDKQLSVTLSEGKGLGLAEVIVKQLSQQAGTRESNSKSNADANSLQSYQKNPVSLSPLAASYRAPQKVSTDIVASDDPQISNPQQFIKAIWPLAQRVGEMLGVDPKAILAQSALETGWGASIDSDGDKNFFGIKADKSWSGGSVNRKTLEFDDGLMKSQRAQFRAYNNYEESFTDYASFLKDNPRYKTALEEGENPHRYAQELQNAGYATDPHYAKKISSIVDSELLQSAIQAGQGEG